MRPSRSLLAVAVVIACAAVAVTVNLALVGQTPDDEPLGRLGHTLATTPASDRTPPGTTPTVPTVGRTTTAGEDHGTTTDGDDDADDSGRGRGRGGDDDD